MGKTMDELHRERLEGIADAIREKEGSTGLIPALEFGERIGGLGEAVITYVDADNTILGFQAVPKGRDIRALVNGYVKEHFIHPQLRQGHPVDSLARTDSYRGEYPHMGPRPKGETEGTVTDGGDYPLTNKLDYVFFKRPMVSDGEGGYVSQTVAGKVSFDKTYPYVHGWALCSPEDYKGVGTVLKEGPWDDYGQNVVWVDGNGSLHLKYSPRALDKSKFTFFDAQVGVQGDVVLKAMYEPGEDFVRNYWLFVRKEPMFIPRGISSISDSDDRNFSFHLRCTFSRIVPDQNGNLYGTSNATKPKMFAWAYNIREKGYDPIALYAGEEASDYTFDSFTAEVPVPVWADGLQVYGRDCYLYGGAYAPQRTLDLAIKQSLTYMAAGYKPIKYQYGYTYLDSVNGYANRTGTEGFVLDGLLHFLAECFRENITDENKTSDLYYTTASTFKALNLRNPDGTEVTLRNGLAKMRKRINNAYKEAYEQGWLDEWGDPYLTWHQLQHYMCSADDAEDLVTGELLTAQEAEEKVFPWCRLHGKCIFAGCLEAAHKAAQGDAEAKKDISSCYLRADNQGTAFADIMALADKLVEVVTAAGDNYAALTWEQVQYAFLHGTSAVPDAAVAKVESDSAYWWKDGGEKVTGWSTLMKAAQAESDAALNTMESSYSDSTSYISITRNLRSDANGGAFASFAAFKARVRAARAAFDPDLEPTWDQIQVYLMQGEALNSVKANDAAESVCWWYDGGEKITSLAILLKEAVRNSYSLKAFSRADLYNEDAPVFFFAKDLDGTRYAEEEMAEFRNTMYTVASGYRSHYKNSDTWFNIPDWGRVQRSILDKKAYVSNSSDQLNLYYWWRNNGNAQPVSTDTIANSTGYSGKTMALAQYLANCGFAMAYNGNQVAMDGLTAELLEAGRLVKAAPDGVETFAGLTKFTAEDLPALKEQITACYLVHQGDTAVTGVKYGMTWYSVQHYILTGEYSTDTTGAYWWQKHNSSTVDPAAEFQTLVGLIEAVARGVKNGSYDGSEDEAAWQYAMDYGQEMGFYSSWCDGELVRESDFDNLYFGDGNYDFDAAGCWDGDTFTFTWYQFQQQIFDGFSGSNCQDAAASKADVAEVIAGFEGSVPAWVTD